MTLHCGCIVSEGAISAWCYTHDGATLRRAVEGLLDAFEADEYLEGEDRDYDGPALRQRLAIKAVRAALAREAL